MKNWLFIASMLFLAAGAASAADVPKLGYVDLQVIFNQSDAGKQAQKEINELIKKRQAGLEKEEKAVKALQKDFEKNKLVMSGEQRSKKEDELRSKMQAFQQKIQESQQEVGKSQQEAMRAMAKDIKKVIEDVAKEQGFTMLFNKQEAGLVFAEPALDVTDAVLKKYNQATK